MVMLRTMQLAQHYGMITGKGNAAMAYEVCGESTGHAMMIGATEGSTSAARRPHQPPEMRVVIDGRPTNPKQRANSMATVTAVFNAKAR